MIYFVRMREEGGLPARKSGRRRRMNEKKGLKLDEIIKFLVSGGICFVVQFVLLIVIPLYLT